MPEPQFSRTPEGCAKCGGATSGERQCRICRYCGHAPGFSQERIIAPGHRQSPERRRPNHAARKILEPHAGQQSLGPIGGREFPGEVGGQLRRVTTSENSGAPCLCMRVLSEHTENIGERETHQLESHLPRLGNNRDIALPFKSAPR